MGRLLPPLPSRPPRSPATDAMKTIFPYIAASTAEVAPRMNICVGDGLAYIDERPSDRDDQGILWTRQVLAHGQGTPLYGKIHVTRQRHAVLALLCQVCGGEPDENDDGILWLLPGRWQGEPVSYPPICQPCCVKALRMCPPLRQSHTVLRVRDVEPYGVLARQFDSACREIRPDPVLMRYGDPRLPMSLGVQQVVTLRGVGTLTHPTACGHRAEAVAELAEAVVEVQSGP